MSLKNIDKELDETILEHVILEKTGVLKGHHLLPKKKSKKKKNNLWLYLILFYSVVIAIIYIQKYKIEDYSVATLTISSTTKIMYLYEFPNNSLYSFCRETGIEESKIRALNPWINKDASNISADAEIIVPIH